MTQGEFALATEQFKKTLEVQPEFYDCHIALGWSQLLNDELPEAHETYQNAISMVDDLADGWAGLAVIYALNANLEQAEQLITKAKALDDDCFLTQIAEVIYNTHKNTQQSQQNLLSVLTNANLPAGDKLARVIEELT
jgi:Tfp pilus assembly protein PilF